MKNRNTKGFTLIETLVSIVIIVLLVGGMSAGINAGVKAYKESTFESECGTLSDILNTSIGDALRYSENVDDRGQYFLFTNYDYNVKNAQFGIEKNNSDDEGGFVVMTQNGGESVMLVNEGVYVDGLVVTELKAIAKPAVSAGRESIANKFYFDVEYTIADESNPEKKREYSFRVRQANADIASTYEVNRLLPTDDDEGTIDDETLDKDNITIIYDSNPPAGVLDAHLISTFFGTTQRSITQVLSPRASTAFTTVSAEQVICNGYELEGWSKTADAGADAKIYNPGEEYRMTAEEIQEIATDNNGVLTLYAKWKYKVYEIALDKNGGAGGSDVIYEKYNTGFYLDGDCTQQITASANAVTIPEQAGYSFTGYTASDTKSYITKDGFLASGIEPTLTGNEIKFTAGWTAKEYNVFFDYNDGTRSKNLFSVSSTSVTKNGITYTYDPSADIITLNGTMTSSTGALTIAPFKPEAGQTYTVTVTEKGGSKSIPAGVMVLEASTETGGNLSTRMNLDFDKAASTTWTFTKETAAKTEKIRLWIWYNGQTITFTDYKLQIKIEAVSKATTYSPMAHVVVYKKTYGTLPAVTRDGYTFKGWYTTKDCSGAAITDKNIMNTVGGVTLYAKWELSSYTIEYELNGGAWNKNDLNVTTEYSVTDKVTLPDSTCLSRVGYSFSGWTASVSGNNWSGTGTMNGTQAAGRYGNVTMTAQWKANTYNVTYNGNGNTAGSTQSSTHTYGSAKNLSSNGYTRIGYTFADWKAKVTSVAVHDTSVHNTRTEYTVAAPFAAGDIYVMECDIVSNTCANLMSFFYGDSGYLQVASTLTNTGSSGARSDGGVQVPKVSTKTHFTVTYTLGSNGNGNVNKKLLFRNDSTGGAGTFEVTNIVFYKLLSGTYTDGQSVTNLTHIANGTVEMTAQWKPNTYTIRYNGNGATAGADSMTDTTMTYDTAADLRTNTFTRSYTVTYAYNNATGGNSEASKTVTMNFNGWEDRGSTPGLYPDGATVSNLSTTNNAVVNLYANWSEVSAITLPNPTRTGYTFDGWYSDSACTDANKVGNGGAAYTPVTSRTLYAKWTANKYTVTFDKQSGTGGSASVSATYGSAMPSATMPTRTGYSFKGYFTGINGTGTKYYNADGTSASTWNIATDKTLYAKWTANSYIVKFDQKNGTGGTGNVTATYDANMPSATMPTRTGYSFGGYFTQTDGAGIQYYNADGSSARTWDKTEAVTLYAKWTANTYTVTLNQGSGSGGTASVTVTYGSAMPAINKPSRTDYTFEGYYTGSDGGGTQYYNSDGNSARTWDIASDTTLYADWESDSGCFTGDTLITMADGSKMRADCVKVGDMIQTFDHFTGKVDVAPISYVFHCRAYFDVIKLHFSDSTEIRVLLAHGFYNKEENKYVIIDKNNVRNYVGKKFFCMESMQFVSLESYEIRYEKIDSYSILTAYDINAVINGMLSVSDEIEGLYNIFDYNEKMQYDPVKIQQDIETYGGLLPYEAFSDFCTQEEFEVYNCKYLGIVIAKGLTTYESLASRMLLYTAKTE